MKNETKAQIAGGLAAGTAAYFLLFKPWHRRWGATGAEAKGPMLGDEVVPKPDYETTRAITIDAPPEAVWPWLVQMGYQRGGLYSYDWLDRLFGYLDRPSAEEILPEYQKLVVGDVIPLGRGPGFLVKVLEPNRGLVLVPEDPDVEVSWATCLYPLEGHRTRMVTRNRVAITDLSMRMLNLFMDPAAFIMVRKWLLEIKRRAEAHAPKRHFPWKRQHAA